MLKAEKSKEANCTAGFHVVFSFGPLILAIHVNDNRNDSGAALNWWDQIIAETTRRTPKYSRCFNSY